MSDLGAFASYRQLADSWDEYFDQNGKPRKAMHAIIDALIGSTPGEMQRRQALADKVFRDGGVTFSVYSDDRGVEKIFPFDLLPRPVQVDEWDRADRGLKQRTVALNAFLGDVYGKQLCFRDKIIPKELVLGATGYLKEMHGLHPPHGVYTHIAGIDLLRDGEGEFVVLEDNLRCPSGVSYVLENRSVLKRVFPHAFDRISVASIEEYPHRLQRALSALAPEGVVDPMPVVFTPGPYNSAYFEHSFLARRTGLPLCQAKDLYVEDDTVYANTTKGRKRVDVIYRRVDDAFLDPEVFRKDSMLGIPGIMRAYAAGNVTICNAPGAGVADDKAIYPYVPDLIRYYLDEEPIIGQVPTYICDRPKELDHVIANLESLVVKAVDGAGGYGMLFGPSASRSMIEAFKDKLRARPRHYIAQPRVEFSACPVWSGSKVVPRRVDLRPFLIMGPDPWVLPGGLTRVALVEGSYVVNSSQGGGSKDTWIMRERH